QGVPAKGTLLCEVQYQHMMPVGGNSKNTIMDSGGLCTLEKGGPAGAKITYVVGLEFNDKGIGNLLYGGGNATVDDKVIQIRQILDAKYVLQLKDGKVVGWSSSGTAKFLSGDHAGKIHTWSAVPTGDTTLKIDYETKE
ncbi:MAG: hypothetical protein WBD13_10620, partial [Burkholderiaceae bacterium]